ncbi:MAG: PHP domain-containing protein [bacterium]
MTVDLHSHSTASDGSVSPSDLARAFAAARIRIAALSDHDTVGGVPEFLASCEEVGIIGIGAVEFSTIYRGIEVHLLGYGLPLNDERFIRFMEKHADYLHGRLDETLRKLRSFGFEVSSEEVYAKGGGNPPMPPHIIRALADRGYITDLSKAVNFFLEYLSNTGKAWVPHETMLEAPLNMLNEVGAIPIVAHPLRFPSLDWLNNMLDMGARGFELYYPDQNGKLFDDLVAIREKRGCLVTGGCDFHGAFAERRIAEVSIPIEIGIELLKAIGQDYSVKIDNATGDEK